MSELIIPSRRSLIVGTAALIAAPAIVRAESLMKITVTKKPPFEFLAHAQGNWTAMQYVMTLRIHDICRNAEARILTDHQLEMVSEAALAG